MSDSGGGSGFEFEGIESGSTIDLNGLRLKVVGRHYNDYLVMLPTSWAAMLYFLLPATRLADIFYRRLILTATVWNLADYRPAEIPHWGHLKWSKEYKKTKEKQ